MRVHVAGVVEGFIKKKRSFPATRICLIRENKRAFKKYGDIRFEYNGEWFNHPPESPS